MKYKIVILIIVFFFSGAVMFYMMNDFFSTNQVIYYQHNGITIKRIDTNGKSTFTYINRNGQELGEIHSKYSGINDGFSGYLQFSQGKQVLLLSGDGYFQVKNNDSIYFKYRRIISSEEPTNQSDLCEIWYPYEAEKNWNKKNFPNSKVKITYKE